MAKAFYLGFTKAGTRAQVREILSQYALSEEFESVFIQGLIAQKHYFLSLAGEVPIKFRKTFALTTSGYDFEGLFPSRGWHRVSWSKCLKQDVAARDFLTEALRLAIRNEIVEYKRNHPECEMCGAESEEVDHVSPEFKDLVELAIGSCNESDLKRLTENFDFWANDPFVFPAHSVEFQWFADAHAKATLMAVCRPCHLQAARSRRGK